MGYVPKKKITKLVFDATTDFDGLEVCVTPIPLGQLMEFEEITKLPGLAGFGEMMQILADAIDSWNVEQEDGTPVVADFAGLMAQDIEMINAIISAWQTGMTTVPAPLPEGSGSGETSPVSLIPMTPLGSDSSLNQAS